MRIGATALVLGLALGAGLAWIFSGQSDRPDRRPHPVEVGYLHAMLEHHGQAVLMASMARRNLEDRVSVWADQILMSQSQGMGQIRGWLSALDLPPLPTQDKPMAWVESIESLSRMPLTYDEEAFRTRCRADPRMPGTPSHEDLLRLRTLSPKERDQLFLNLMVLHHESAIEMSKLMARHGRHPWVLSFAKAVIANQRQEIRALKQLL